MLEPVTAAKEFARFCTSCRHLMSSKERRFIQMACTALGTPDIASLVRRCLHARLWGHGASRLWCAACLHARLWGHGASRLLCAACSHAGLRGHEASRLWCAAC
eukprot:297086-Chlamydomonas_euryale.AAC.2